MTALLSKRLRKANELIHSLAFFDVYGKVARTLLNLASERGRVTEQGTVIDMRLTGIHVKRDSEVSVRYAEELNSSQSSVLLQRADRHEILGQKPPGFQLSL